MSSLALPASYDDPSGESKRFGATLTLSLIVHAIILLGVGFSLENAAPVMPTLDVIVTETTSALTPAQADFLAQAANVGGGEHDKTNRPREAQAGMAPQDQQGVAPRELRAQSPTAQPEVQARVVSSAAGDSTVATPELSPTPTDRPLPPGKEKIERDMAMARLAAEIHLRSERYAKRPKRKFVSASTQAYAWATYLRDWVDRVERVGNLNYPDEARRRKLAGQVVISVAIRRDGSVERSDIVSSSGIPLLDESALRIAKLAEPYPPLPRTEESPDVLHVTRTWAFLAEGTMVDQ